MRGVGRRLSSRELARNEENAAASRAAKADYERAWAKTRCCAAPGCDVEISRGKLFCRDHWFMLPASLRRSIVITFQHRMRRDYAQLYSEAIVFLEGARG